MGGVAFRGGEHKLPAPSACGADTGRDGCRGCSPTREPLDAATLRAPTAELRPAWMRPGYGPDPVTAFLREAAVELERRARDFRPSLSAEDVTRVQFARTWWKPGFNPDLVDALLSMRPAAPWWPDPPREFPVQIVGLTHSRGHGSVQQLVRQVPGLTTEVPVNGGEHGVSRWKLPPTVGAEPHYRLGR